MFTIKSFKKIITFTCAVTMSLSVLGCATGAPAPEASPQKESASLIVNGIANFPNSDELAGYSLTSESTELFRIKGDSTYYIAQGACSDGTHVYGILRNIDDTGAVIRKVRLSDGGHVATSAVINLGHGNDMTYDSKNNRLVIAHGISQGKILTLVNAEDLSFIEDINIEAGAGAITYNEKRDCYAISQGGKSIHFLDSDFKLIKSLTRTAPAEYVAQGMGSDDKYLYFPMSNKWTDERPFLDNIFDVYDWDGNHVAIVHIPVAMESESMFWVNGKYYVAYNNSSSMAICETVMKIKVND